MKEKKSQLLFDTPPEWNWVLPFSDRLFIDSYLDSKIGFNENISSDERWSFLNGIQLSLSLSFEEKQRVFYEYKKLSRFQFDELNKVWEEERQQFEELKEEHFEELNGLTITCLLIWSLIFNSDHGDFIFFEKIIPDFLEKIVLDNASEIENDTLEEILEILDEKDRYFTIYAITKRILYESNNHNLRFKYYDYYFYSLAHCKKIDKNFVFDAIKEIDLFKIEEEQKNLLKLNVAYRVTAFQGFSFSYSSFNIDYMIKLSRNMKKIRSSVYKTYANFKFFEGQSFYFIKNYLKYFSKYYDNVIDEEFIEKITSRNKENNYHMLLELFITLSLYKDELLINKSLKIADVVYNSILNEERISVFHSVCISTGLFLEIMLDKQNFSSMKDVRKFIKRTDNPLVEFWFSANNYFNSVNDFIDKSKKVISTYDTYNGMIKFSLMVLLFLLKKSRNENDTKINSVIIQNLLSEIEKKGIVLTNEKEIFQFFIDGKKWGDFNTQQLDVLNRYLKIDV